MRKILLAACAAACVVVAAPVMATTFPSPTTIYIVPGVVNSGDGPDAGVATVFQCSNVSGVTTAIRLLSLSDTGAVLSSVAFGNAQHGQTITFSTHLTTAYTTELVLIPGTALNTGVVNIESLQSAVFCTAAIIDAAAANPDGVTPHIIRVNPDPGTVE